MSTTHNPVGADTPTGQLSARISAAVLSELDAWNSAFWDLKGTDSDRLQAILEHTIERAAKRWLDEQGIDAHTGVHYREVRRRNGKGM